MIEELAKYLIAGLVSAAIGIIGYLLKDIRSTLKERLDKQEEEIKEVKKDLSDFKGKLPQRYVLRDDFLRAISNLDHKVDNIYVVISDMNKNIAKLLGVNKNE